MKNAYEQLYIDCLSQDTFLTSAHFAAMKGQYYDVAGLRFLLIGRAANGWGRLDTASAKAFGEDAVRQFGDYGRWDWIESVNGVLYNAHDRDKSVKSKRYCIDRKPFWSYAKAVWQSFGQAPYTGDVWMKNIAWSNLYKVSPLNGGNPAPRMLKAQQAACIEIVKQELALLHPTHILIMTGFDWFAPFSPLFDHVRRLDEPRPACVEGTASYGGAKVVITCRPEYRDKKRFLADTAEAFGQSHLAARSDS
ncbi:MAG: hypothetical protein IJ493_01475 [Clostridia bacterium]|nr:hypothetical protein [Clostridia bacterium]